MATLFVATRLALERLGENGFGEFQLARRTAPVLSTGILLGLGVALPRAVAEHTDQRTQRDYLVASLGIVAVMSAVVIVAIPFIVATRAFGEVGWALTIAIAVLAAGLAVHGVAHGFERGRLAIWRGTLLASIPFYAPLPVLILWPGSAAQVIATMGILFAALGLGFLAGPLRGPGASEKRNAARGLLRFGVPRIFGDVALYALLAIPAWHLAREVGVVEGGLITVAIMVVQGATAGFGTASAYLLPLVRRWRSEGRLLEKRRWVDGVALATLVLSIGPVVVGLVTFGWIADLVVGESLGERAYAARWLILGLPGWLIYVVLRNPIDALSEWPLNAFYLVAAAVGLQGVLLVIPVSLDVVALATGGILNVVGMVAWFCWWWLARQSHTGARRI